MAPGRAEPGAAGLWAHVFCLRVAFLAGKPGSSPFAHGHRASLGPASGAPESCPRGPSHLPPGPAAAGCHPRPGHWGTVGPEQETQAWRLAPPTPPRSRSPSWPGACHPERGPAWTRLPAAGTLWIRGRESAMASAGPRVSLWQEQGPRATAGLET